MSTTVTIPTIEEYAEATLNTGEADHIYGWLLDGDYLFGTTEGPSPKVLKVLASNLATRSTAALPGTGHYTAIVKAGSALFSLSPNVTKILIARIVPSSLAVSTVVDDNTNSSAATKLDALATDGSSFLFVLATVNGTPAVVRYNLDGTGRTVLDLSTYTVGGYLRYINGKLYITGRATASPATTLLIQINGSAMAITATQAFPASVVGVGGDFIEASDEYIWVGFEDIVGKLYYFQQSDLAVATLLTGETLDHARIVFDGMYVWNLLEGARAVQINPSTREIRRYGPGNIDQGFITNLAVSAQTLYVSFFGAPTKIARYRVIPYGTFRWVALPASAQNDFGNAVACDASGNVIFVGSTGGGYIQVNKYSPSGALLWHKQYGSGAAYGVDTDSAGNVYVTGQSNGGANFGGDTSPLIGSGYGDIFVLKLRASDGYALWAVGFVSTGEDAGRAITVDSDGNVLLTGSFMHTINFGGGARTALGGTDIFVVKLSGTDGDWIWDKTFGSAAAGQNESGFGIAVDADDNACVTGCFVGPASFGGAIFSTTGIDTFIVKLAAANGAHIWSRQMNGTVLNKGLGIACFSNDDVAVVGHFFGSINPGNGLVSSTGREDIFIARYAAANGAHIWSETAGGTSQSRDSANAVAIDAGDNLYVAGAFIGTINLGTGDIGGQGAYAFVARLAPDSGVATWSKSFGGQSNTNAYAIAADNNGCTTAGQWYDFVDFGDGVVRRHIGAGDAFLLQLTT
jgi:hypothetical protein